MKRRLIALAAIALAHCGRTGLLVPNRAASDDGSLRDGGILLDGVGSGCETAGIAGLSAPRPIAPLSTGVVTSQRPTLHWSLAPGTTGACVELCRDRACASPSASFAVDGSSLALPTALAPGVTYWRSRGRAGTNAGNTFGPTWQFTVGARSAPVDTSWGPRLDVDGDGAGDVIAGAMEYGGEAGRVYVFRGSTHGLSATPGETLEAPDGAQSEFGARIGSAGDVNGDGYSDALVAAPAVNAREGRAYLFLGSRDGFEAPPRTIAPPTGVTGFAIACDGLGDFDGDGYADVAIGAKAGQDALGAVYVYRGGPSGLGAPAFVLRGDGDAFEYFAEATTAGDIDGDGFGDVLVAAPNFDPAAGRVYVYRGTAGGLVRARVIDAHGVLAGYFGAGGWAGDVNGDGYSDLVAGATGTSAYSGYVEVYLGSASGLGRSPVVTLGNDGVPEDFLSGGVATVGDVNGDGFDDLGVGASNAAGESGRLRVFYGGPNGPSATSVVLLAPPDMPFAHFGEPVARANDVDRDGIADVVAGSLGVGSNPGALYEFLGARGGLHSTPDRVIANPSGVGDFFAGALARWGVPVVRRPRRFRVSPWPRTCTDPDRFASRVSPG